MIRMLNILVFIVLSSLAVNAQIFTRPNNSYGQIWNRGRFDSTFFFATHCGVPSGTMGLHSRNEKMAALYYDSCGHNLYVFDPTDSSWSIAGGGADNSIATGSRSANGDYVQDWMHHWFFLNNLKAVDLNSYSADPNHPGNKKRFSFYSDSTIDGNIAQWMWGMKNINEDNTDSLHFELTSTKDITYLYQHTFGGEKSIEMDWDAQAYYPGTKIYANGNGKNGYYDLNASVASLEPNDSTRAKLVSTPGAAKVVTARAESGGIYTLGVADMPTGGSADSAVFAPNYRLDTAKVNIRSICQWPAERPLGTIYEKSSWVNPNEFTTAGTALLTMNGSYLDLSGGNGTFGGNYVRFLPVTNLAKWKVTVILKLSGTLNSGDGMAGGLIHANPFNPYDITGNISFGNTGSSNVYIATTQGGGTVYATSAGTLSFSGNNLIKVVYELKDSAFTVTATNLTTDGSPVPVTKTWAAPINAAGQIPNSCYFALYPTGGTQQIQYLKVESDETRYASLALIGDSKWQVGFADHWYQRVGNQLNAQGYGTTITRGGEGDGVNHILDGIDEIRMLAPRVSVLQIGSNSKRAGFTDAQVIATYDSLTTAIEAIGTKVLHVVLPEDSVDAPTVAVGMSRIKQYISTKYASNYINVWDTLADGSNRLKAAFDYGDGAHLNQAGINAIVTKIIQSGKISICAERIADDQFARAQISNNTTTSANTGNYINNSPTLQTGQFNLAGQGQAYTWVTSPASSPSNAGFSLTNISTSSTDAPAVLRPTGGGNKSMELYIVPSGAGAGGNLSSFNLFNSDYIGDPSNFGYLAAQMKASEFDLHTGAIGSGTLVPIKLFTGSNTQMVLNTDGTNSWTGNTYFNNQVAAGPSFTTPFSKALIHAHRDINDGSYIIASNNNTSASASTGLIAALNPSLVDTNSIAISVLGKNYSHVSRPGIAGGSALVESTTGQHMYINNYTDTGAIVFTTKKPMVERLRIASGGAISFGNGSNSYTFPTTRASAGQVMTDVAGDGVLSWQTPSAGSSYTFSNGLTESAGAVKWGGALTQNTTIDGGSSYTTTFTGSRTTTNSTMTSENSSSGRGFTGTSASGVGVVGASTSGNGVYGQSGSAFGVYGNSTSSYGIYGQSGSSPAIYGTSPSTAGVANFLANPATTNTTHTVLKLTRATTGTPASGIAGAIDLEGFNSSSTSVLANQIAWKLTTVTAGSETSQFEFMGVNAGVFGRKLAIAGNGQVTADGYGSGTFTGTITRYLGVTSAGAVVEQSASSMVLVSTGTAAPATTPAKVGDIYVDTTNKKLYFATGTSSSADWTIAN